MLCFRVSIGLLPLIFIVFLFTATGLTDNCTTSTLFHNQFIQFFSIFQQFNNITVSVSIIMHISIKIEPKINSWGSYTATGTEITEKGKLL